MGVRVAERLVATPAGDARLVVSAAAEPRATLALGHGASGGIDARDLRALADGLPATGISVVRVEQPWRVAGRRVAPRPPMLDAGWLAALDAVRGDLALVVGGRSAGARVACRTAAQSGAVAVVALAFPLHPPGRPERSRLAELTGAGVPTLVVQGGRDPFGRPEEFPAGPFDLVPVPQADHGLATPMAVFDGIVAAVRDWLGNVLQRASR
ncbi:MAG: hydrolase [Jiangellaceae bacterium]|nr:hydrolase [Jiangellaceae bacterium]